MPSGDLARALQIAQAFTWDQRHGYAYGGLGNTEFDCSGFVERCLHDAGFSYAGWPQHVGTMDMDDNPMSSRNSLGNAGFQLIHVTDLNNIPQLQHGDIVVMNSYNPDWTGAGGHTFFYAENIYAYTDPNADSDAGGTVARAKIEASSDRGHSAPGDSRKNGTGAYWEVWTHAYSTLIPNMYDPQSQSHHNYVTIARWPGGVIPSAAASALAMMAMLSNKKRRRLR